MSRLSRGVPALALSACLAACLLATSGCAAGTPSDTRPAAAPVKPTVHERVQKAVAASDVDDKPVLLVLADASTASTRLAHLLARPRVASAIVADYHLVRVDVGTPKGAAEAAARGVRLQRSGVPAVAVLVGGQAVYASADRRFAHPATLGDREVVRWLGRWS